MRVIRIVYRQFALAMAVSFAFVLGAPAVVALDVSEPPDFDTVGFLGDLDPGVNVISGSIDRLSDTEDFFSFGNAAGLAITDAVFEADTIVPGGGFFLGNLLDVTSTNASVFELFIGDVTFSIDLGPGGDPAEVFDVDVQTTVTNGATFDYTFTITTEPVDSDNDGVGDDVDLCPATVLPDAPTRGLKTNRYAASIDGFASTDGVIVYALSDTGGCSGTQIIAEAGLGKGHTKYGISGGALEDWITSVS